MKTKVLFLATAILSILSISCATTKVQTINSTIQEAQLDLGSLPRDQYVIIGKVEGEGRITAKTSTINKQIRSNAEGLQVYNNYEVSGDNGKYGFINSEIDTNMSIIDKAIAMATYKMIQAAQYNNADTVIYVTTTTTIVPNTYKSLSKESFVIAKVSGLAVKIKTDSNIQVKIPSVSEQEKIDDAEIQKLEDENALKIKKEKGNTEKKSADKKNVTTKDSDEVNDEKEETSNSEAVESTEEKTANTESIKSSTTEETVTATTVTDENNTVTEESVKSEEKKVQ